MNVAFSGGRDLEVGVYLLDSFVGTRCSILVGDCPTGIDKCVRKWAKERKLPLFEYEADWKRFKRAAGPIRNEEMVKDADKLVAFWDGKSKGTKSAIMAAFKYKVNLQVIFMTGED